ncbi:MAG: D-alanine--D-alanine ligase [Alphaproteobacteria bacterium]
MTAKRRVAVFFGGRSPEHDVSIVTGLQALGAVDASAYDAFPVYISSQGEWFVGDALRDRANYLPDDNTRRNLTEVMLDATDDGEGQLVPRKSGMFGRGKPVNFDVALLAFHGNKGEDGQIQGLFEMAGVPYTGMRTMASAALMDKSVTKRLLAGQDISQLDCAVLRRPADGLVITGAAVAEAVGNAKFPACVKPCHLGSSIGVAKVDDMAELREVLPSIFRLDPVAIMEPFVPNLVEYNVAVSAFDGEVRTSAIERPKRSAELLDFKEKYMSGGGGKKGGSKALGTASEGMLSLTRDINPNIPAELEANIRDWAAAAYAAVGGTGAPRIDFLGDSETGELWLNEVNPCPGSFGYFLWEAATPPMLFTELLSHLIEEAVGEFRNSRLPSDPTPKEARLFKRPYE